MILVVGATGRLGSAVCQQLVAHNRSVRATFRPESNPARVRALQALGVQVVQADLRDRASLVAALRGANVVMSAATALRSSLPDDTLQGVDLAGQARLVDVAREARVERFVCCSVLPHVDTVDPAPLTVAQRALEQYLLGSGLEYTVLRLAFLMDVWLSPEHGFDFRGGRVQLYGQGRMPVAWVALHDVARYAAICVDHPAARNACPALVSPDNLSQNEVVRVFEDISGRPFEVSRLPLQALRVQRQAATHAVEQSYAALMIAQAEGCPAHSDAPAALGLRFSTVRDYARGVLGADARQR